MNGAGTFSRRQFVQLAVAGAASAAWAGKIHSVEHGVHVGMETFSLRNIRYPDLVPAVAQTGIGEVELFAQQIEPTTADAPDIMKWRSTVSLDFFRDVRKKFNQAGIEIHTYNARFGAGGGRGRGGAGAGPGGAPPGGPGRAIAPSGGPPGGAPNGGPGGGQNAGPGAGPNNAGRAPGAPPAPAAPLTDDQIERVFEFTKALGAKTISSQTTVDIAKRLVPFAEKHKMIVAVASSNPDVLAQIPPLSPWLRMDVDIGDLTRGGHDALQFVKDNYQHLLDVHLKDCKFQGVSVPFGQGDSHMKEVLQFVRDKKLQIRANIDCDYPGTGSSVDEVKKCLDYIKSCLA